MDLQGSRELAVHRLVAWNALNDPEILKACIPGCDKVEATGENQYTIGMAVKIGPVSARFTGKIRMEDVQPPERYTLKFEGQGGPAGFGKGQSTVVLTELDSGGCRLDYTASAQVGGKIAQVGQRLIDGVARSMAEDFFKRFEAELVRLNPPPAEVAPPAAVAPDPAAAKAGVPTWIWAVGAVVVVAVVLLIAR